MVDELLPDIIEETSDFLILYKPSLMHSVLGKGDASLASWISENIPSVVPFGRRPEDCGLLNRLDYETSGLLVAARSIKAKNSFLFEADRSSIKKRYLFVSRNSPEENSFFKRGKARCDLYISQKTPTSKKVTLSKEPKNSRSQPASTSFTWIETNSRFSLYEAEITSGRRHQIRAHAAGLKIPLLNDGLYGGYSDDTITAHFFLHNFSITCPALGISCIHPSPENSAMGQMLKYFAFK